MTQVVALAWDNDVDKYNSLELWHRQVQQHGLVTWQFQEPGLCGKTDKLA